MREFIYAGSAVITAEDLTKESASVLFATAANDHDEDDDDTDSKQKTYFAGGYPHRTIVVFDTQRVGGSKAMREYRIALIHGKDFIKGLRCPRKEDCMHLNPQVARPCFERELKQGEREVYYEVDQAIAAAEAKYAHIETGVKVLYFDDIWPGSPCRPV
jgi:hypothetical protein